MRLLNSNLPYSEWEPVSRMMSYYTNESCQLRQPLKRKQWVTLNEQMSAPNRGREPMSRACGCSLEPQGQAAWHSSWPWNCTHHPLPSGGVAEPQILLGALLGLHCPQNSASGTIWKSVIWLGQTHARACSKLNIMDDGMPELNRVPWSDLVYPRNLTGETRGSTGARKCNLNSLCVVIQVWDLHFYD